MNAAPRAGLAWSTSCFGEPAAASRSRPELSALTEHLCACRQASGRLFTLRCAGEVLHGVVAPRLVTTLAVAVVLLGLGSIWF